ncbi:hypothetical protein TIFTF001_033624 [Ficus carica]|uniref:Uncharacterized protein n=1 Tax=Ficus carica TaxID=3494 RepID=A0AA88E144_FICCA|nr:hypothetical protein TIFTF001_033624 [Ficus carica]
MWQEISWGGLVVVALTAKLSELGGDFRDGKILDSKLAIFCSAEKRDRVAVELSSPSSCVHDLIAAGHDPIFSGRYLDLINSLVKIATLAQFRFVFSYDPVTVLLSPLINGERDDGQRWKRERETYREERDRDLEEREIKGIFGILTYYLF